ncbi:Hsp20/alpha crystallin family protein [Singulisphaera sp. PoT]|uniref:Hsp20/alpha crystallin family protein n=1 Tax=Singulisphaera sp. PoT TaxID=3411797 RepID=UPI003BF4F038
MLPNVKNGAVVPFVAPANRLDALFDRLMGEDGGMSPQGWARTPMAMWADDDHIWIEAEMPGVSEPDLDVTVHKDTLFIRAERKPQEGRRYVYNGRSFGRFERAIALPEAVDADNVRATLKDGVLCIELAKRPESKPKKIAIQAG